MFNIGGLFQKFKALQAREIGVRNIIAEEVMKNTGMTININDIDINNGIVFIKKLPQAAKNVLFMKKGTILEEVNKKQIERKILNIKF